MQFKNEHCISKSEMENPINPKVYMEMVKDRFIADTGYKIVLAVNDVREKFIDGDKIFTVYVHAFSNKKMDKIKNVLREMIESGRYYEVTYAKEIAKLLDLT